MNAERGEYKGQHLLNKKVFVYFSEIFGRAVIDSRNRRVGVLADIAMKINGEIYPRSAFLIVKRQGLFCREYAQINWDEIEDTEGIVQLKCPAEDISFLSERPKYDFTLCVDILDQQIVDVNNQKVVRVNDIHLLRVDHVLYLAHVDVGLRGLVRRLNWTRAVDFLVRIFSPKALYLRIEDLIPWKNTQVLSLGRVKNILRLDVARRKLSQIPSIELAQIMQDLDLFEQHSLFKSLDIPVQRKVFSDLSIANQRELIKKFDDPDAVDILENIPPDEAADLLMKMPKRKVLRLMKIMESEKSKKLRKLLGFSRDSAGGLMNTEFFSLPQGLLVNDALQKIKENAQLPIGISQIYVVDEQNHLLGMVPLKSLISANPETPLSEVFYPNRVSVYTNDGVEKVALLLEKYKFTAIPVLNEQEVLQGIITVDDVMEELISIAWAKYKEKL